MVVCKIARVRNTSLRTFYIIPASDPFNTPCIGGAPCTKIPFEVPPGFDETATDLIVPWSAVANNGFVVRLAEPSEKIRCVVGPTPEDGNCSDIDWLRLHDSSWESLLQEHWLALGHRHLLGAIEVVEVALTFHDQRGTGSTQLLGGLDLDDVNEEPLTPRVAERDASLPEPASAPTPQPTAALERRDLTEALGIAQSFRFDLDIANYPPNTVLLNVFDLVPAASLPNALLCNVMGKAFGAFHAAVEVHGDEYSFYKQLRPRDCGVCRSRYTRQHPVHIYRQSIKMGTVNMSKLQVRKFIATEVAPQWPSSRYDIVRCNCICFCDELLERLGVEHVPPWVKGLHETGAVLLNPLSLLGPADESGSAPPEDAETF